MQWSGPSVGGWAVLGFSAGIAVRSFVSIPWVGAASAAAALLPLLIIIAVRPPERRFLLAAILFAVAASIGMLRYDWRNASTESPELDAEIGNRVAVRGVIVAEPDERERATRLVVEARQLDGRAIGGGKILATVGRFPEFSYGDIVELSGALEEPENFSGDFDYRAYLAKDGIRWEFYFPEINIVGESGGLWVGFRRALFALKREYLDALGRALSEPQSALAGGLTVGARKALPEDVTDNFRRAGILHVLVLSGYNMTIVARVIGRIAPSFIPYAMRLAAGLAGIAAFALMAGASATVARASLMAAIVYVAGISGRVYQAKIALVAAGLVMLAANPRLLRFDLSFQLSFLATAGLLWIAPRIESYLRWLPKTLGMREYGISTVAAQLAVTPLLLYSIGTVSLVAFPANIATLVSVPASMLFGFLAGSIGILSDVLAAPFAWVAWMLGSYELGIAEWAAWMPFSEISLGSVPLGIVLLLYGVMGWLVARPLQKSGDVVKEAEVSSHEAVNV